MKNCIRRNRHIGGVRKDYIGHGLPKAQTFSSSRYC
jgi:hypothetical protein